MSVFKEKTVVLEMSHDQKLLTLRATSQTKNEKKKTQLKI